MRVQNPLFNLLSGSPLYFHLESTILSWITYLLVRTTSEQKRQNYAVVNICARKVSKKAMTEMDNVIVKDIVHFSCTFVL